MSTDFDVIVKLNIYESISKTGRVPTAANIAATLGTPVNEVIHAFSPLHQQRLLVPEPENAGKIRMAPPFSGIKTPFAVKIGEKTHFANCVWDALGVPAALHQDAEVVTECAYSGEPMNLAVQNGRPLPIECAIHFAVPAAKWWDDIIYT